MSISHRSPSGAREHPSRAGLKVVAWTVAFLCTAILAWLSLDTLSRRLVADSAEATALGYAHYVAESTPGLQDLLDGRPPAEATLDQLRRVRALGDVFRFRMLDREGRQLLVSDDLSGLGKAADGSGLGSHHSTDAKVSEIVLGGGSFIEIKDGRAQTGRPDVYVEAYVPLRQQDRILGIVEVYVDQTAMATRIQHAFAGVGAVVAVVMLVLGGAAGAQVWRRQRDRRSAAERLRYLAEHDVLSGALNRSSFHEALKRSAWRHGQGAPSFAVLCIDLDRFKEVNDTLGHAAGDAVLSQASARLRTLLRHGDALARLGGDEFAVLQSAVSQPADAAHLAERIVQALAAPYQVEGQPCVCGGSVGVAHFGVDAHSVDDLLHKADLALYRAKSEGRGRYSFFDANLDRQVDERRQLARDMRQAIADNDITLHYQPLYEAGPTRKLVGYEALMRWTHPTRGPIGPAVFIPLAEESGQIEPLGVWALRRACAEAATWPSGLTVSVNLSPQQFLGSTDLVATVAAALDAAGLTADRLVLEITESLLMTNTDRTLSKLEGLAAMGCQIAMDDFGTGYSSLAYLWRFPFNKLKIDRAFTQGLATDSRVALIVHSIVTLAHSMGIRVNAEGVETAQQLKQLQLLGCDELQGFLLGRPMPASALSHGEALGAACPVSPPRLEELLTQPVDFEPDLR